MAMNGSSDLAIPFSTRSAWRLRPWNVMSGSLSATDSRRMVLVPSS